MGASDGFIPIYILQTINWENIYDFEEYLFKINPLMFIKPCDISLKPVTKYFDTLISFSVVSFHYK